MSKRSERQKITGTGYCFGINILHLISIKEMYGSVKN